MNLAKRTQRNRRDYRELKDAELSKKDRAELEERQRELNSLLSQFDRDGS